jgi:hypothetical protein
MKIEDPNQFVPLGTTKKEFKKIQAAVSMLDSVKQFSILCVK